jgi:predicted nucleic acid-binding protein
MIALDTNILIYACDKADPARQQIALELISNTTDVVNARRRAREGRRRASADRDVHAGMAVCEVAAGGGE